MENRKVTHGAEGIHHAEFTKATRKGKEGARSLNSPSKTAIPTFSLPHKQDGQGQKRKQRI